MSTKDDFASLMESAAAKGPSRAARHLSPGQVVEGTVIQIGSDSLFLDVGTARDARIDRGELEDKHGNLSVKLGDSLRATVLEADGEDGIRLTIGMGRGSGIDAQMLSAALESGAPVSGQVSKAVKAGLEVDLAGVRAFCPASQVDVGFISDLAPYVGQTLEFKVLEVRDGGRSVVISRRALLEVERAERARQIADQLKVGSDMEGTVSSVQKYGALVDLGGVEGMIHISELAHQRVDQVEDVVQVGERVTVRVLSLENDKRGLRVRLSLRALVDKPASDTPQRDEVLDGSVTKVSSFGVFVSTAKGEGLVPLRELALPPGADHRKAFPVGKTMQVVVVGSDPKSGKLRLSVSGVDRVIERNNYKSYREDTKAVASTGGGGLGSLGELLRAKLGLEPSPAAAAAAAAPAAAKPAPASANKPAAAEPARGIRTEDNRPGGARPVKQSPSRDSGGGSAPEPAAAPVPEKAAPGPAAQSGNRNGPMPDGVVRRRR